MLNRDGSMVYAVSVCLCVEGVGGLAESAGVGQEGGDFLEQRKKFN